MIATYPVLVGKVLVEACQRLATHKAIPSRLTTPVQLIDGKNVASEIASYPQPGVQLPDPLS